MHCSDARIPLRDLLREVASMVRGGKGREGLAGKGGPGGLG
jgi:hypothetical protein